MTETRKAMADGWKRYLKGLRKKAERSEDETPNPLKRTRSEEKQWWAARAARAKPGEAYDTVY